MKALMLAHSNGGGGAGRAAGRLFTALDGAGVDVSMHVDFNDTDDPRVFRNSGPFADAARRMRITMDEIPAVLARHPQPQLFSPGFSSAITARRIDAFQADVVNVHWTNFGYLSIKQLGRIRTPLAWTLHDMWALTGGCNYDDESLQARWRNGFTAAKPDGMRWDVERWVWGRKTQSWTSARHLITPSTWLAQLASHSEVVADWPVHVIPNALDTHAFSPGDSAAARLRFGIDPAARVALVALGGDLADPRKGLDLLRDALTRMGDTNDEHPFELMVVGRGTAPDGWGAGLPRTHWLGFVDDDAIVDAYRAADVVVVPSRQDNLPQTATEPHACGTPVVAFRIGGLPDIVDDRVTGYLAAPGDSQDLANGITWVLADEARRASLGAAARQRALDLWDARIVGAAHARLFAEIAQDRH
jgi:glycosyltransferase involved in cell wall biosynthesis